MYRVQLGKLFWKRHIDQMREVAGSKVADIEPTHCELTEIDLAEPPDATLCLCQRMTHHHNQHRLKSPLCPWCHPL